MTDCPRQHLQSSQSEPAHPSLTLESLLRTAFDKEGESKQATAVNLEEFLIWKHQPLAVVKDFVENLSTSIKAAETDGSVLHLQEKDAGQRGDVMDQRKRSRAQRKASTQSNKGWRERPRAQRTPSVKSKKVVNKRKVERHFQSDKIQRDCQGTGRAARASHSRSSDQDTLDKANERIDGVAWLQEMRGEEVDKLGQPSAPDPQHRSIQHDGSAQAGASRRTK